MPNNGLPWLSDLSSIITSSAAVLLLILIAVAVIMPKASNFLQLRCGLQCVIKKSSHGHTEKQTTFLYYEAYILSSKYPYLQSIVILFMREARKFLKNFRLWPKHLRIRRLCSFSFIAKSKYLISFARFRLFYTHSVSTFLRFDAVFLIRRLCRT